MSKSIPNQIRQSLEASTSHILGNSAALKTDIAKIVGPEGGGGVEILAYRHHI